MQRSHCEQLLLVGNGGHRAGHVPKVGEREKALLAVASSETREDLLYITTEYAMPLGKYATMHADAVYHVHSPQPLGMQASFAAAY